MWCQKAEAESWSRAFLVTTPLHATVLPIPSFFAVEKFRFATGTWRQINMTCESLKNCYLRYHLSDYSAYAVAESPLPLCVFSTVGARTQQLNIAL